MKKSFIEQMKEKLEEKVLPKKVRFRKKTGKPFILILMEGI